jgi:catechol 2,3-dioxygenase
MSRPSLISEVGHIALQVRDLDAVEEFATNVTGLKVTERSADGLWLTAATGRYHHGTPHHSLHCIRAKENALDHVGFVARDADAVDELRQRVGASGYKVLRDGPDGPGVNDGFAFTGPEGLVIEIYSEMQRVEPPAGIQGVPPLRLGHIGLYCADPQPMIDLLIDVFGFRVSDWVGPGWFLRCNVDHHAVGIFPSRAFGASLEGGLSHCAWEVPSIVQHGLLADLIDSRGGSVLWGPIRHSIGRNIATYFTDPSGLLIEYYADMEKVYDDEHHVPTKWDVDDKDLKWLTMWAQQDLPDEFVDLGLPFGRTTE